MRWIIVFLISFQSLFAQAFTYNLQPQKISENSYYLLGKAEYFSVSNGANIANAAFIVTPKSVIVIDSGSTLLYGEELIAQIKKITPLPIRYLINTHHHPDHFLGNAAFKNATIFSTQYTHDEIRANGDGYLVNLTNLCFEWMKGTEVKVPNRIISPREGNKQKLLLNDYALEVFYLDGHTQSDLAIYDTKSKILYASDLVFYNRTPATPHANIPRWIEVLKELSILDYNYIVPGHGPLSSTKEPIEQTLHYLYFLDELFTQSAKQGLDIYEVLELPIPKKIASIPMFKEEFERSVINLYPKYELEASK